MVVIGIILIVLVFCILSGIAAITNQLQVIAKNQIEIIRVSKNNKK